MHSACLEGAHKLTSQRNEDDLRTILDRLLEAGLLSRQGVPPDARYLFKHALVQHAAYGILPREPRRALHARIAEAARTVLTHSLDRSFPKL
jgi:predicted ATPase